MIPLSSGKERDIRKIDQGQCLKLYSVGMECMMKMALKKIPPLLIAPEPG